jgi:hypothetical protein
MEELNQDELKAKLNANGVKYKEDELNYGIKVYEKIEQEIFKIYGKDFDTFSKQELENSDAMLKEFTEIAAVICGEVFGEEREDYAIKRFEIMEKVIYEKEFKNFVEKYKNNKYKVGSTKDGEELFFKLFEIASEIKFKEIKNFSLNSLQAGISMMYDSVEKLAIEVLDNIKWIKDKQTINELKAELGSKLLTKAFTNLDKKYNIEIEINKDKIEETKIAGNNEALGNFVMQALMILDKEDLNREIPAIVLKLKKQKAEALKQREENKQKQVDKRNMLNEIFDNNNVDGNKKQNGDKSKKDDGEEIG